MALAAPIVFQCGACHRVVTDSNQLLSAVAELSVLVFDAVVGLRVGEASSDDCDPLLCGHCSHPLGRLYTRAPRPELEGIVHREDAPRFSLQQDALVSYVLGSAGAQASGDATVDNGSSAVTGAAVQQLGADGGGTDSQEATQRQLTQLMRVVLALDERLRALEGTGAQAQALPQPQQDGQHSNGAADERGDTKRARS